MKKLLAVFGFAFIALTFIACGEEGDGCLDCISSDPNFEDFTICADADGLYLGRSEGDFKDFQFASGFDCN